MARQMLVITFLLAAGLLSAQTAWKTFSAEGFIPQVINTHFEDKDGNLWLGTTSGAQVYSGDRWVAVSRIEDSLRQTTESLGNVISLREDPEGLIWVIGQGKLFLFDGKTWISFKDDDYPGYTVKHLLFDSRGDAWLCSELEEVNRYENILSKPVINGTVTRFDGLRWFGYGYFAGGTHYVQHGDKKLYYSGIVEDQRGYVWIGSVNGLHVYAGQDWITLRDETLPSVYIHALLAGRNGNVWVGTPAGIAMFDGVGWRTFRRGDGLGGNNIRTIREDQSGNIWAFVYGNVNFLGLSRFDGGSWTFFSSGKEIPSGPLTSDPEFLSRYGLVLTRSGIAFFDGKDWNKAGPQDGLEGNQFFSMDVDTKGKVWVCTDKGLFRGDGKSFTPEYKPGAGSWEVVAMLCDTRGRIWVATATDEVYLHEDGKTRQFTASDGLLNESVREIVEDHSGRIWLLYRKGTALYQF